MQVQIISVEATGVEINAHQFITLKVVGSAAPMASPVTLPMAAPEDREALQGMMGSYRAEFVMYPLSQWRVQLVLTEATELTEMEATEQ